ncbi:hypothetical protein ACOT7R_09145 [Clostridium perfringens]|uniref:hypothetical protein n=1 Tax=Clostridium perfringens TaxID=1502 RepID=UPI003BABD5B0
MNEINFENGSKITTINTSHTIRGKRRNMRILDDPEGFFKDMSNEEFIKLLDEMGFNCEIKDGVEVENKQ